MHLVAKEFAYGGTTLFLISFIYIVQLYEVDYTILQMMLCCQDKGLPGTEEIVNLTFSLIYGHAVTNFRCGHSLYNLLRWVIHTYK